MSTEEAVQTASNTAPVASEAPEAETEEQESSPQEEANAGLKALAALQKLADKFGHRIREGEKKAALARWDAGKAFLPAVNTYCDTAKASRKDAIDAIGIRMRAATGDSRYDVESDIRFGVLMEYLSEGGDKDLRTKLSDVAYRLLVPMRQLVTALPKSDSELFRYDVVPHVEEQVLNLRDELLMDQCGAKPPRVLRDDKVNLKVKHILAASCERESAVIASKRDETLTQAGVDREELEIAILNGDDAALTAAAKAVAALPGHSIVNGHLAVGDIRAKVAADGKASEHRKAAQALQSKIDGTTPPKGSNPRKVEEAKVASPADQRKAFEAELTTVSKNDSATEYRARLANTLIGKSVAVAVEVFSDLPGETLGSVELIEALLHGIKDAKPGTLVAIIGDMCKKDHKFRDSLGIAVARSKPENKPTVPAPVAQRFTSVTVAPAEPAKTPAMPTVRGGMEWHDWRADLNARLPDLTSTPDMQGCNLDDAIESETVSADEVYDWYWTQGMTPHAAATLLAKMCAEEVA